MMNPCEPSAVEEQSLTDKGVQKFVVDLAVQLQVSQ